MTEAIQLERTRELLENATFIGQDGIVHHLTEGQDGDYNFVVDNNNDNNITIEIKSGKALFALNEAPMPRGHNQGIELKLHDLAISKIEPQAFVDLIQEFNGITKIDLSDMPLKILPYDLVMPVIDNNIEESEREQVQLTKICLRNLPELVSVFGEDQIRCEEDPMFHTNISDLQKIFRFEDLFIKTIVLKNLPLIQEIKITQCNCLKNLYVDNLEALERIKLDPISAEKIVNYKIDNVPNLQQNKEDLQEAIVEPANNVTRHIYCVPRADIIMDSSEQFQNCNMLG